MADELKAKTIATTITPEKIRELIGEGELAAIVEITLKDKDGKVVEHRVQKSESFVRQFLDLLQNHMYGSNAYSAHFSKEATGGYASIWHQYVNMSCNAAAGSAYHGIAVGISAAPPAITDFVLWAQIAHGTGVGQLQYGNIAFGAVSNDTTSSHFTVTRDFANASGASITVNEIGLYLATYDGSGVYGYHLCIRDVIAGGLVVPNGQTLTINYRIICTI